jgi:ribosomal protein L14E/L6E/L27E
MPGIIKVGRVLLIDSGERNGKLATGVDSAEKNVC